MRIAAVAALALALAASSAQAGSRPNASDLEAELVCPTCKTTLDQSNSPVARRMKAFIRARIAAGDSEAQIKARLVDDFGPAVLAEPPKSGFDLLAWVLPLAGLAAGAVAVGLLAWRWSSARVPAADAPALEPELERRLDDELAHFDG